MTCVIVLQQQEQFSECQLMLMNFFFVWLSFSRFCRSATGGGTRENPAGTEQGARKCTQTPPEHHRGSGTGNRGEYFCIGG